MPQMALRLTTAACAVLAAVPAAALARNASGPEAARQQLLVAHQASHARGVCGVFEEFQAWQAAYWPDGRPAFERFMNRTVLPNFLKDKAAMAFKTPLQVQGELKAFCAQAKSLAVGLENHFAGIAGGQAGTTPTDAERAQAAQLLGSLRSAAFRGECKTASPLLFDAPQAEKARIEAFVRERIYARDPRYRQSVVDVEGKSDAELLAMAPAIADNVRANQAREEAYWKDCDAAEDRFHTAMQSLMPESP